MCTISRQIGDLGRCAQCDVHHLWLCSRSNILVSSLQRIQACLSPLALLKETCALLGLCSNASMGVCNAYLLWASSSDCTWCVFQVQHHMAARFGDWHACQPLPLLLGSNCLRLICTC